MSLRCDGPLVLVSSLRTGGTQVPIRVERLVEFHKKVQHGLDLDGDEATVEETVTLLPAPARAALFASRNIETGEQLGFDYYDAGASAGSATRTSSPLETTASKTPSSTNGILETQGRTRCCCGSPACRGWLPLDQALDIA
ncbi:hypothetical protein OC834_004918 [Tilletia horrida]|nr:hypothetical protein OC834_004918 [Tilletia horrida]KAK0539007.1 hypothetical protein OC835_001253 [Tilletia horrida]